MPAWVMFLARHAPRPRPPRPARARRLRGRLQRSRDGHRRLADVSGRDVRRPVGAARRAGDARQLPASVGKEERVRAAAPRRRREARRGVLRRPWLSRRARHERPRGAPRFRARRRSDRDRRGRPAGGGRGREFPRLRGRARGAPRATASRDSARARPAARPPEGRRGARDGGERASRSRLPVRAGDDRRGRWRRRPARDDRVHGRARTARALRRHRGLGQHERHARASSGAS